ncbi:hypothetical protein QRX25_14850 [Bacillus sp. L381]|uniref:hypothetical protein n=1 Tax=Bacillus TaxID=1386 RepID=UPI001BA81E70|nr:MULTISPECIES: hypothetical protein [Bacillus]MCR9040819.1 hypothetical protein [Bacillus velezensis]QUN08759.1 hypothetical protein KEF49_14645 [Bacillus amyloliquefaciens]QYM81831.1 hypothetical protein KTJ85_14490 [Bacillus sp. 7D3]QZY10977.1 hypothetical protein K7B13_14745 [Bacillus amyloliquefaciens]WIX20879.1 hypothetical protein QRX25_14850 [Bacillus sp. L381]
MGLYILACLVSVTVFIIFVCNAHYPGFIEYLFGAFFGVVAAVVVFLIAVIPSFCIETKPVNPHKTEIYSIKDNAKTSGSFVLGSGSINEKQYFYFVKEKDGFKTVSKTAVEDSKMKEGKYANPYVLTYDMEYKSPFARFFYGKEAPGESYEFYLPEDTITTEYKIDLE